MFYLVDFLRTSSPGCSISDNTEKTVLKRQQRWGGRIPRRFCNKNQIVGTGSTRPRNRTGVSCITGGFFANWAIRAEKALETHSSTLAWKIPWTEEPGRLQSMGSLATSLSLFTFMHWRRNWQPPPVFLPGESQGWGSLVGCRQWGHTELDMTEAT